MRARALLLIGFAWVCLSPVGASSQDTDNALASALSSPLRTDTNRARDGARHPCEMLRFFGLKPTMSVVEIWPGGGYWTEILAPYLRQNGHYVAATGEGRRKFNEKLRANQAYDHVQTVDFADADGDLGPANSADLVLTFRNLHDWVGDGEAEAVLHAIFEVLKPGGVLGIEDHRGRNDQPQDPKAADGYLRQDYAIALIEKAGFKHVADSDVAANPRDTKDYPKGVWTLPPTLRLGDKDSARYIQIGESDRFVMKFVKPLKAPL